MVMYVNEGGGTGDGTDTVARADIAKILAVPGTVIAQGKNVFTDNEFWEAEGAARTVPSPATSANMTTAGFVIVDDIIAAVKTVADAAQADATTGISNAATAKSAADAAQADATAGIANAAAALLAAEADENLIALESTDFALPEFPLDSEVITALPSIAPKVGDVLNYKTPRHIAGTALAEYDWLYMGNNVVFRRSALWPEYRGTQLTLSETRIGSRWVFSSQSEEGSAKWYRPGSAHVVWDSYGEKKLQDIGPKLSENHESKYFIKTLFSEPFGGNGNYTSYKVVIDFLNPSSRDRKVTITGSSLDAFPDTVVDTTGLLTIGKTGTLVSDGDVVLNGVTKSNGDTVNAMHGTMSDLYIVSSVANIFGDYNITGTVTDSNGVSGKVLLGGKQTYQTRAVIDFMSSYIFRATTLNAIGGIPPYSNYQLKMTFLHPDQNGRAVVFTAPSSTSPPTSVTDTSGNLTLAKTGAIACKLTTTINNTVVVPGSTQNAINGSMNSLEIVSNLANIFGDFHVDISVTDATAKTITERL